MLFRLFILLFMFAAIVEAHQVRGSVQVFLKGDEVKEDLSSVIVYLQRAQAVSNQTMMQEAMQKQGFNVATKNKQFVPRSLAIPVGAIVTFPNYDPIFHNIFSVSKPNDFDLGLYKGGTSKTHIFQAPGIVKVFCNVHPQMTATIVVTDTPYFSAASTTGTFDLGWIPNGEYDLNAYSDEGAASQKIQVGDKPLQIQLTIDGRKFKKLRHKNKYGKDYSTDEKY